MKIAFTVTGPDLARALATIARDAARPSKPAAVRPETASTVSREARHLIADRSEADDAREP